jgi:hypothetical protein
MPASQPTRVQIDAKVIYTVTDPQALIEAAVADINQTEFTVDNDSSQSIEDVRAEEAEAIKADPAGAAALHWFVDSSSLVADHELPGVEFEHASDTAFTVSVTHDPDLNPDPHTLDQSGEIYPSLDQTAARFADLHEACSCGQPGCQDCDDWQLTARTAFLLYCLTGYFSDAVYDDIDELGDDPITSDDRVHTLSDYPRLTWNQDAVWRRQAARAFDDLGEDLLKGRWPTPRCIGEEMALYLILRAAPSAQADEWFTGGGLATNPFDAVPEHSEDYGWDTAKQVLFQDHDFLQLFNASLDGIEDPDDEMNRNLGMGDLRAHAWFKPFDNVERRDGRRPFRR